MLSGRALGILAVAAVAVPGAAQATTVENQFTASSVTSYVAISYNTQYCSMAKSNKYKLTLVEYRWSRTTTTRKVAPARFNFGEFGQTCSKGGVSLSNGITTLTPCWGCGNSTSSLWTKSYLYFPDWPYVALGGGSVGAWAESTVTNSSGTTLAKMCVHAYATGFSPCN